jgi:Flp pilus assembly protein TadD
VTYDDLVANARRRIRARAAEAAIRWVRKAICQDPSRPEAFNLLGAATALKGGVYQAQNYYRAALALDPTYAPALANLEHSGRFAPHHHLELGDDAATRGR